jgi:hypothetical protein
VIACVYNARALLALRLEGNPHIRVSDRRKIESKLRRQRVAYAGEVAMAHLAQTTKAKTEVQQGLMRPPVAAHNPWKGPLEHVLSGTSKHVASELELLSPRGTSASSPSPIQQARLRGQHPS